ncbi:Na-translocating system protein MpsC family protein [Paenibacillus chartarius]|uniref:Na-translocating system protein MpsC family protein n=1 Tax=Paenibacillus chartarius TaxID=747481 RepID=A0ABV6DSF8_9BACL
MEQTKIIESEIAKSIGRLLRDSFGKGPDAVFVSIGLPYVIAHLRNFLSPMEKVLIEQNQEPMLRLAREAVMRNLTPKIGAIFKEIAQLELTELLYEWDFDNKSAVLVASCSPAGHASPFYSAVPTKDLPPRKLKQLSAMKSEDIASYHINTRTLLVIKRGILGAVEKQFIEQGQEEQLKHALQTLESKGLARIIALIEKTLDIKIHESFILWSLPQNMSLLVFILYPPSGKT